MTDSLRFYTIVNIYLAKLGNPDDLVNRKILSLYETNEVHWIKVIDLFDNPQILNVYKTSIYKSIKRMYPVVYNSTEKL
jgi:hypothetical protein